jgi:outer membrane autotransporter protein
LLTPFIGVNVAHAELDGFTESDHGTGAALRVNGSDGDSVSTLLGLRLNGTWGAWRPEVAVGWQHEYDDTFQTISASFAGAPKGSNFQVVGTDLGRDAVVVDAGTTYLINPASDFTVRYYGTWLDKYDSQSVMGRFTWKFGATAPVGPAPAAYEPLKLGQE